MAKLIANNGGLPTVAPSMREVPLESNVAALTFAVDLLEGSVDMVIFLTGVGARALTRVVETAWPRDRFVAALQKVTIVARGPKPVAALRELGVPVTIAVPEPNTWRELLQALEPLPLDGRRIAVQEYGVSNPELLAGLENRGAIVTPVPVYQWALPADTAPLRSAVAALARGEFDLVLFTTSVQVTHLLQVAAQMDLEDAVRQALDRLLVASIGPTTTEALREHDLPAHFEPTHPKMGLLVKEAAAYASSQVK